MCELRSRSVFCSLTAETLTAFEALGSNVTHRKSVKLFEEETPGAAVFVVCSGRVKLSCTSREGKTLLLRIAVPGDILGLGAVISGSRYEVTAETLEPTQLKQIRRDEFLQFLSRHGEASLHSAQALSKEYRAAFFDARRLALSDSAAGRLAGVLLDWGRAAAIGKAEMRFAMALTHEELANLIGTSRETVTRVLGRFKKENLIQISGASVLIINSNKLEQLAA
jgi:CRP/FNR family transcriptional regulator